MRKVQVAVVAPSLDILGGQAVQAQRLLDGWRDSAEIDAWLVPVNPSLPPPFRFTRRVKYLRTVVNELCYLPLLARELARADVVHVFSASYSSFLLAPLPAIAVARMLGRPVILNYHSGEAPDHLRRSAVARAVISRADRTVVPSRFLKDVFARYGIDAAVIGNVVDIERFRFRLRDPLRPRILSTRNLESLYNVACTLRAFRIVQHACPDASLTVVGTGSEEGRLRQLAHDLGLRHIIFEGRVDPDRIADLYASHDIYIQSPNIDNMPTSVLEAYASGLPIVSTEAGGVPAILTHGIHGLLAPLDDHQRLASHVLALLGDAALARRLALGGRDACGSYTWPSVRDAWLRLYRGVLTDAARAPIVLGRHARP